MNGHRPKKFFAIVTRGRTGSTALAHDLDQHPQVICHSELFTSLAEHDRVPTYQLQTNEHGPSSVEDYLEGVFRDDTRASVLGFKILKSHFDERASIGLWNFIVSKKFAVLHLVRNPLFEALSGGIANARGLFNIHAEQKERAAKEKLRRPVMLNPDWLCNEIRYSSYASDEWRTKLANSGLSTMTVNYEDYAQRRMECLNRIFSFLGVSQLAGIETNPFQKVTSSNVWDDIINKDEVIAALVDAGIAVKP